MTSTGVSRPQTVRPRRSAFARLLRWLLTLLLVAILLPYSIAPLYRFVDPVSTLMVWRWLRGHPVQRVNVTLDAVAPILPRTVIVAEDARFCSHPGVDWRAVQERIEEAEDWSEARGASTLTQQVAKNLFLWPGRSFVRKALEAPLALWIDLVLPKRRVMELYLNVAEWGPSGQFGVEAGARRAFNKSARNLSPGEAAVLAAVLPNPHRRSARQPGPAVRRIAGIVQTRTAGAGNVDGCLRRR